jgi:hypothetical protein
MWGKVVEEEIVIKGWLLIGGFFPLTIVKSNFHYAFIKKRDLVPGNFVSEHCCYKNTELTKENKKFTLVNLIYKLRFIFSIKVFIGNCKILLYFEVNIFNSVEIIKKFHFNIPITDQLQIRLHVVVFQLLF